MFCSRRRLQGHRLQRALIHAPEYAHVVNNARGPVRHLDDGLKLALRTRRMLGAASQRHNGILRRHADHGERLVQFMRHAGGQFTKLGQFRRLRRHGLHGPFTGNVAPQQDQFLAAIHAGKAAHPGVKQPPVAVAVLEVELRRRLGAVIQRNALLPQDLR